MPPPHAPSENRSLLGSPFFQRYGVNLPSSLTEGRSLTCRVFTVPTSVGLRYGRTRVWLEAFLGGLEGNDFRSRERARNRGHARASGICLRCALPPVHLPCPTWEAHFSYRVPSSLITTWSGAGLSNLLAIAYDYDVLGLGPDYPWDDGRCPGTLRHSVYLVLADITLLIPAFALLFPPPVLAIWLLR